MESLTNLIASSFWLFLPAGVANMMPSFFARLNVFDTPVDLGRHFLGQPIFGPHKTYRGFLVGVAGALATVWLQRQLYPWPHINNQLDYAAINIWLLGGLIGLGALGGDLIKSFFKRRLNIPSGWIWAPFDQLDWIIGAVLLTNLYTHVSLKTAITSFVIFGLLHPLVNLLGYLIRLKPNKF